MEREKQVKSVSDRDLSDSPHPGIKKSQRLRRHTRAQIACGTRNKRVDLKRIAFDIKEKEIGTILHMVWQLA